MTSLSPLLSTTLEQLSTASQEVNSSSSASSSSSDDSSASDSDSDSSDSDDDDEEDFAAQMQAALAKAKASARASAAAKGGKANADSLENQDEVVLFGTEEAEQGGKGKGKANSEVLNGRTIDRREIQASTSKETLDKIEKGGDKWGRLPTKSLSKKERKDRHPRTAGPQWFNLPAPTMTPELKRELQAMRMRNSLDPKRFYRGGAKDDKKLPEFFSLGHVVESNTRASTLTPAIARKRTFVEELVEDDQARAYTKRKTAEVMARGMSGRQRQKKNAKQNNKNKKRQ